VSAGLSARLVAVTRSPVVRLGFLVLAVGLAVVAVVSARDELADAVVALSPGALVAALVLGAGYVWFTLLAWRAVLADLGSTLSLGTSTTVFGLGQIGKYVPGGVWNVVAAAELGADHQVPRSRSLAAMAVATLVGLVSGCVIGAVALAASADDLGSWRWAAWAAPLTVLLLAPQVLNRVVAFVLRLARRPAPEHELTARGMLVAVGWSLAGWVLAGLHLVVLAADLGMELSWRTVALCVGGYAAAWVAGFLVIVVPAGAGAREAALLLLLAGSLTHGAVLLTVLVSRVLLTLVDLAFAGAGYVALRQWRRGSRLAPQGNEPVP